MKKTFTLLALALFAVGAFAQEIHSNAVGVYRTQTSATTFSTLQTATFGDITVSQTAGTTTSTADLDNDTNYGESTAGYYYRGTVVTTDDGKGRIYPITKCTEKDENSYIGVKLSIPEGKKYSIDRLLGQGLFGATFYWCVDVVKDGEALYTTGRLKCNDYKKVTTYMDSISVTKDSISGLCAAAVEQAERWITQKKLNGTVTPEEYILTGKYLGGEVWGNVLTDAVKGLSGDVELRLYYWGQKEKPLVLHSLYVELSEDGASGITQVAAKKNAKSGTMYNLAGQRVDKSYKGMVIMDGRKYVNK